MARSFFDTSALVKHYHFETGTATVDRLINEPGAELAISRLTLVETISVFATKVRTGTFDAMRFARLRGRFASDVTRKRYRVIRILNTHYNQAQDLIRGHGLARQVRSLDALQLAVALNLHQEAPLDYFVCADHRLCDVALSEGLAVLNPELVP
ncbi:MAG: type II toxin-antitoxin system VapC family toxin [Isosphaeraceae bacterium]